MSFSSHPAWPALPDSGWGEFWLWLWRSRRRVEVVGNSMAPTLQPGDQVFWNPKAYTHTAPTIGELVIAQDPRLPQRSLIKRVTAVQGLHEIHGSQGQRQGQNSMEYELSGDNPGESTDSRHFGRVRSDQILGQVTSRLP